GRRSSTEAMFSQEPGDGGFCERGLDPTHRSATSRAGVEVGTEDVSEKPRPPIACRRSVVVALVGIVGTDQGKRELVTRRWGRSALCGIARWFGDDLAAQSGVAREHAEVAQNVQSG